MQLDLQLHNGVKNRGTNAGPFPGESHTTKQSKTTILMAVMMVSILLSNVAFAQSGELSEELEYSEIDS